MASPVTQEGFIHRIPMDDWASRVRAFLLYGNPSQKMLIAEGEAGCGKSEITVQVCRELGLEPIICPGIGAQQMEEFLALTKLEVDEHGNGRVIQGVCENNIPTARMSHDVKYRITVDGKPKTVIPWIIDECFTGTTGQMNQLRAALTFRKIGSIELPPETYIIGTTNPESVEYSSRRTVDAAVMDRCAVYRVYMEFEAHMRYLASLEKSGRYPQVCRMFLRMPASKRFWELASPRFWHSQFGLTWQELSSDPGISEDKRIVLFKAELENYFQIMAHRSKLTERKGATLSAASLLTEFQKFMSYGSDPKYYPISGNDILAPKNGKEEQVALFEGWNKAGQHNLIGVTIQDTLGIIGDKNCDELDTEQAEHLATLLDLSGGGLVSQFCMDVFTTQRDGNNPTGTKNFTRLMKALSTKSVFSEIQATIKKQGELSAAVKAEKNRLSKKG